MKKGVVHYEEKPSLFAPQKVIVILLILAIVFSIGSTLINLSLLNFELKPIQIKIPAQPAGNPNGGFGIIIEGNPALGGNAVADNTQNNGP